MNDCVLVSRMRGIRLPLLWPVLLLRRRLWSAAAERRASGRAGRGPSVGGLVHVGRYAYGAGRMTVVRWDETTVLRVGAFCSIAKGV